MILLSLLVLGAAPTLSAKESPTAALFVQAARQAENLPSTSLWLDSADRAFRRRTGLGIESPERLGLELRSQGPCPPETLLGCMLANLEGLGAPPFALVLTLLPLEAGRWRVVAHLLEVASAQARRSGLRDPAALEDQLVLAAWHSPPVELDAELPADFERRFDQLAGLAEAWLGAHGVAPPARLFVDSGQPAASISVDGVPIGALGAARGTILDLRAGARRISVDTDPGRAIEVELRSGQTSTVSFVRAAASMDPLRSGLRYAGPAVVALGGGVLVWALLRGGSVQQACLGRDGTTQSCPSLGNATLGLDPAAGPSTDPAELNPAGLDLLALGVGLASAGVSLAAFAFLGPEEAPPPWWAWLVSAAALGLGYGVTAVGGRP